MTVKHESLHFAVIEDMDTPASKLSLKALKPSKVSTKAVKKTVETFASITPYRVGVLDSRDDDVVVMGPSSLLDDPESFDVW